MTRRGPALGREDCHWKTSEMYLVASVLMMKMRGFGLNLVVGGPRELVQELWMKLLAVLEIQRFLPENAFLLRTLGTIVGGLDHCHVSLEFWEKARLRLTADLGGQNWSAIHCRGLLVNPEMGPVGCIRRVCREYCN